MAQYIVRRLLLMLPVLLGISFITFALLAFAPGDSISLMLSSGTANPDAIARIRETLELDQPWYVRYMHYLGNLFQGDLGRSVVFDLPVAQQIAQAFPNTLVLTAGAMLLALTIAVVAGVTSAARRNSLIDYGVMVAAIAGVSMPSFWLGLLLIILFGLKLQWLPIGGGGLGTGLADLAAHLVLPVATLGAELAAILTRLLRNSLLDILSEDYVRTARAKGLANGVVLYKHALRNALLPLVTTAGLQTGALLGGAVIVETIFSWPGMGSLAVTAIQQRDLPVIQGTVLVFALCFMVVVLLTDLLYAWIDPRIRYD